MPTQSRDEASFLAGTGSDQSGRDTRTKPSGAPLWRKLLERIMLLALVVAALAALSVGLGQLALDHKGTLDFANFYTAGKIIASGRSGHLYDLRVQQEVEREVSFGGPFEPYYHPPFEAPLFVLFSGLSYPHAFQLWATMNLFLLGLVAYLLGFSGYRLGTGNYLVWLGFGIPLAIGALLLGQDTLLLLPVFLIAFFALKKRREFAAGLALGLGLFRFEILLPFVFIFLLRRRWKLVAGFAAAGLAAMAVSMALIGLGGLLTYGKALVQVGSSLGQWAAMTDPATMPSLRGALATSLGGMIPPRPLFVIVVAGTVALLGWAAWQFRSVENPEGASFDLEFSLATLAALLASYHVFVHEMTPLIVVGFLMLGYEGVARKSGAVRDRAAAPLLLLFAIVFLVGGAGFGFRNFSVLFIVLLGLMVWLSQEISALGRQEAGS